ncbi:hypothetical protein E2C01_012702 [Portunus trituberculatus]|uniref:Uncharacterized protein n=1 Tax=Portunus trituberculatus TaxID=210409 RepID=A0A5B7DFC2_PORTR|nr:hypothetical protein [Portunus trituberculatus]
MPIHKQGQDPDSTLSSKSMNGIPHTCEEYSIHGLIRPLYRVGRWRAMKDLCFEDKRCKLNWNPSS